MIKTLFIIALGGGLGSVFRYLTWYFTQKNSTIAFPYATLLVNIVGCILIGFFIGFFEKNTTTNPNLKYFFITGFCGGLTTFSAFGAESFSLFSNQNSFLALLYIGTSIFLGILAIWLGLQLSK